MFPLWLYKRQKTPETQAVVAREVARRLYSEGQYRNAKGPNLIGDVDSNSFYERGRRAAMDVMGAYFRHNDSNVAVVEDISLQEHMNLGWDQIKSAGRFPLSYEFTTGYQALIGDVIKSQVSSPVPEALAIGQPLTLDFQI